jgi:outer membrane protein assembly factor BamA
VIVILGSREDDPGDQVRRVEVRNANRGAGQVQEKKVGLGIETLMTRKRSSEPLQSPAELPAEGRQYADVQYLTDDAPPNAKNDRFVINEGPKVKVKKIEFHGNTVFSDRDLRGFIVPSQASFRPSRKSTS